MCLYSIKSSLNLKPKNEPSPANEAACELRLICAANRARFVMRGISLPAPRRAPALAH